MMERRSIVATANIVVFFALLSARGSCQVTKRTLPICGVQVEIGSSRQIVDSAYSDGGNSCKLLRLDKDFVAVVTPKHEVEPLGYIRFKDGSVSELERPIVIEGEAKDLAFKLFHLLQDFERSSVTACTISSFENKGGEIIVTARGTELTCGNRSLKLVTTEFTDGKQFVSASEILRK